MAQTVTVSEADAILRHVDNQPAPGIHRLAGILTTAEILAAGRSRTELRKLLRDGSLASISRGVYADATLVGKFRSIEGGEHLLKAAAALAFAGPGAVASHQTAAQLHGINVLGHRNEEVVLTGRASGSRRARSGVQMYSTALPAGHLMTKFQLPITTPARTVVDLARTRPFRDGVVAADSALHDKLTTKQELRKVVAACRRWPGVSRAVEVVEFADALAESPLESIARVVFRDCGLPAPELQVWLGDDDLVVGRVDFFWRRYRTVAEVDGRIKYADPVRAQIQLRRDAQLRKAGFEVVHFDWQEITAFPAQVVAEIRAAFQRGLGRGSKRA